MLFMFLENDIDTFQVKPANENNDTSLTIEDPPVTPDTAASKGCTPIDGLDESCNENNDTNLTKEDPPVTPDTTASNGCTPIDGLEEVMEAKVCHNVLNHTAAETACAEMGLALACLDTERKRMHVSQKLDFDLLYHIGGYFDEFDELKCGTHDFISNAVNYISGTDCPFLINTFAVPGDCTIEVKYICGRMP